LSATLQPRPLHIVRLSLREIGVEHYAPSIELAAPEGDRAVGGGPDLPGGGGAGGGGGEAPGHHIFQVAPELGGVDVGVPHREPGDSVAARGADHLVAIAIPAGGTAYGIVLVLQ